MRLKEALKDLGRGKFVLVRDSSEREDETDMVIAAEKVEAKHVTQMRRDGGGLICVAIHPKVARKLGLPYLSDIYRSATSDFEILNSAEADDIPYDERSSFSISVNHRDTFTGITDSDRALTIRELGKLSSRVMNNGSGMDFGDHFRTPGHVPILRAAENLLEDRVGHTELSVALAEMAGISPAVSVCEMMDEETKGSMSGEKAERYAEENGLVYLEGKEIREAYTRRGEGMEGR